MAAGTLGLVMTSPGQSYVVSIFIEHFIRDLGISRSLVSTLYTGATLAGSFALPFVGRQIDRLGARRLVIVIAVLFGSACFWMGNVQNALMLGCGFVAIRLLGQGSLGLVSVNVINQWWIARRGLVMGISGVCVSLFGLGMFPVVSNTLIGQMGWRNAYLLFGVLLIGLMLPVGYFFFRNRPEEYGLQPDGGMTSAGEKAGSGVQEENWTLPEALKTPAFWVLAGSAATMSMLMTGLVFHQVSLFGDQGYGPGVAAGVFVPLSITMAIVNLGGGLLADRLRPQLLLVAALVFQAITLFLALQLNAYWLVLAYGIGLGATSGFYRVIMSVMWAKYFGRLHLGSIMGVAQTFAIAGSALGPMPLGIARDTLGSYTAVLMWSLILPVGFGIANLFVGRPIRK